MRVHVFVYVCAVRDSNFIYFSVEGFFQIRFWSARCWRYPNIQITAKRRDFFHFLSFNPKKSRLFIAFNLAMTISVAVSHSLHSFLLQTSNDIRTPHADNVAVAFVLDVFFCFSRFVFQLSVADFSELICMHERQTHTKDRRKGDKVNTKKI